MFGNLILSKTCSCKHLCAAHKYVHKYFVGFLLPQCGNVVRHIKSTLNDIFRFTNKQQSIKYQYDNKRDGKNNNNNKQQKPSQRKEKLIHLLCMSCALRVLGFMTFKPTPSGSINQNHFNDIVLQFLLLSNRLTFHYGVFFYAFNVCVCFCLYAELYLRKTH